ncbi:hypothetical protein AVEN_144802-1 [Araneus ventricosus]|uniref:Uncharacterized protein n=1 Tax=Araneus ventricosus TaxID=182803 RepID=A0A4Y2NHL4_ARAVE|nr:hypothetical protein AVEN_144802-1 [Araneus ventricosus]
MKGFKLGIHELSTPFHMSQRPVYFPFILVDRFMYLIHRGSKALHRLFDTPYTPLPARLTPIHPPSPRHGEFSRFRESTLPSRSDFSNISATLLPNALHTQRVMYRQPRRIIFHFYGHLFQWITNLVGIPTLLSVNSSFHLDFTLTKGFAFLCSKKCGVEQW